MPSFLCAFFAHHCANLRPSVSITPDSIRHLVPFVCLPAVRPFPRGLHAIRMAKRGSHASPSKIVSSSPNLPRRQHTLRWPYAEVRHQKHRLSTERRCKDTSKVNNVFLCGWKFYQKIVFFSFSGLIKEPFDDYIYPLGLYPVLRGYHLSRLTRRRTVCPCHKVVIHHSLIPHLNPMPCLRHPKIVRIPYQPRYVI